MEKSETSRARSFWVLDWARDEPPERSVQVGIYNEQTLADLYFNLDRPNHDLVVEESDDFTYDETYAQLLKLPDAELPAFWKRHLRSGHDATRRHQTKGPHQAGSTMLMNLIVDGEFKRACAVAKLSTADYLNYVSPSNAGQRGALNELASAKWPGISEGPEGPRLQLLAVMLEAGADAKGWCAPLPPLFEACSNPDVGEPFLERLRQAGAKLRCQPRGHWKSDLGHAGHNVAMAAARCFHVTALRWLLKQKDQSAPLFRERASWPALSPRLLCALEVAVEASQRLPPDAATTAERATAERAHLWLRELLSACAATQTGASLHPAAAGLTRPAPHRPSPTAPSARPRLRLVVGRRRAAPPAAHLLAHGQGRCWQARRPRVWNRHGAYFSRIPT